MNGVSRSLPLRDRSVNLEVVRMEEGDGGCTLAELGRADCCGLELVKLAELCCDPGQNISMADCLSWGGR